jgi:hypothetical protein
MPFPITFLYLYFPFPLAHRAQVRDLNLLYLFVKKNTSEILAARAESAKETHAAPRVPHPKLPLAAAACITGKGK